jgi:hypothetical protein
MDHRYRDEDNRVMMIHHGRRMYRQSYHDLMDGWIDEWMNV